MTEDKWISVDKRSKKLVIRFRVKGFEKQFFIATGLENTKKNINETRKLRDIIENDIFLGEFDPSLKRYKKNNKNKSREDNIKADSTHSLIDLWSSFIVFQSTYLEKSTIEQNYKLATKIISKLPNDKPNEVRNYLLENYSYTVASRILQLIRKCYQWAVDSGILTLNPFEKIKLPKPKKQKKTVLKAFTLEQRDLIIEAFENHSRFLHYANIIKFLFWTGCRPGEAVAITWNDISDDCLHIHINKAYSSRSKYLKGTKNGKERTFVCSQDSKLQKMLLSLRPPATNPTGLVFVSKRGERITNEVLQKCWHGSGKTDYEYLGVVKELATAGKVPLLNLYATRHTFATWAIAQGNTPDTVAYWLGDDVSTVLKYYCHPEVSKKACPDF